MTMEQEHGLANRLFLAVLATVVSLGFFVCAGVGAVTRWQTEVPEGSFNYFTVTVVATNGLESLPSNMVFTYFGVPRAAEPVPWLAWMGNQ